MNNKQAKAFLKALNKVNPKKAAKLSANLADKHWRMNNLYWIIDKNGCRVQFKFNWAQQQLFIMLWFMSIILKARQLGITTFICIFALDECIFNDNFKAGIIAHNREDAESFFAEKVKYAWDEFDPDLKAFLNLSEQSDTVRTLRFSNNSAIRVGTSMRSGTLNFLHISEFGKICAKYPEKAREIVTGSFNTVQAGQTITVESTAEGQAGYFFDYCQTAKRLQDVNASLSKLDFQFFFFPWYKHPEYRLDPSHVRISLDLKEYFTRLEEENGIVLDKWQRAWYAKKFESQQEDMQREYPSTPEEAFSAQIKGCFFAKTLVKHYKTTLIGAVGFLQKVRNEIEFVESGEHDLLEIWRYPVHLTRPNDARWTNRYTIGADISEGLGQDYSVAYVYDRVTHEFVARMRSNKIDSVEWARMLMRLAIYYCSFNEIVPGVSSPNPAFIVPERTGAGITTCKILLDNGANVYFNMVVGQAGAGPTKQVGWVESKQAKYDLAGDLREYFENTKARVYCANLLGEAGTFIKHENGKLGHAEGFNDDCVIAAGLALQGHYALGVKPGQIAKPVAGWRANYMNSQDISPCAL